MKILRKIEQFEQGYVFFVRVLSVAVHKRIIDDLALLLEKNQKKLVLKC